MNLGTVLRLRESLETTTHTLLDHLSMRREGR